MARANPQWRRLESGGHVLVIFTGPEHYITPNWYPSKEEHGKVVPTFNYVAVHAMGAARLFEDTPALLRHLNELTDAQESRFANPWSVSDAPAEYVEGLTKAIVGVEITIDKLEGKWKASQNRPVGDQEGVVAGLDSLDSHPSREMADLIRDRKAAVR